MVLGFIVVNLMNGDSGVDNGWLDCLLVDNRLNSLWMSARTGDFVQSTADLMNMMVDMLSSNDRSSRMTLMCCPLSTGALELGTLLFKLGLDGVCIAMVMLAVLHRDDVMLVLLREDFTILDGLDRGVIVVLVDLTVDSSLCFLMAVLYYGLILNRRSNLLMHGGIMVTSFRPDDIR